MVLCSRRLSRCYIVLCSSRREIFVHSDFRIITIMICTSDVFQWISVRYSPGLLESTVISEIIWLFLFFNHWVERFCRLFLAWNLDSYFRRDFRNIAVLMTWLLGLNFPANSVGVIPAEMLSTSWEYGKDVCWLIHQLSVRSVRLSFILDLDSFDNYSFR
jgi:hypothetical protein